MVAICHMRHNRVLASLASDDFARLEHHLRPTSLKYRQCVEAANRRIETVYFPYTGIISVVANSSNRRHEAEVGLIGSEGMSGLAVVLGTEALPFNALVQVQ